MNPVIRTISWTRGALTMSAFGREVRVTNEVRTLANGKRALHKPSDVVRTTPGNGTAPEPYDPRGFPSGVWRIVGITPHPDPKDKYLNPYFISTDAKELVESWGLDSTGGYDKPTGRFVPDAGYGLHYLTEGTTTLGCIRIVDKAALLRLVSNIQDATRKGEVVQLVVS